MAKRDFHPNKNCPTRVGLAKKKCLAHIKIFPRAFTTSKVDHPQAQPHTHIIGYIVDISSLVEELMLGGRKKKIEDHVCARQSKSTTA
jgi:hypothetical protein